MKHEKTENKEKKSKKFIKLIVKIMIVLIFLGGIYGAFKLAPNYIKNDITDRTNLIINYSNVTGRMKNNLIVENDGVVYISFEDIKNYYDNNIYYDKQYDQIVTSSATKLATLKVDENKVTINGEVRDIKGCAKLKGQVYYLPVSEMESVYNIKLTKADNKVIIESLDKKLTTAVAKKKLAIKYKPTVLSRTIEKVDESAKLSIADVDKSSLPEGWLKVRSQNGNIGFVEEKNLSNIKVERNETDYKDQIEGKVSLVWDYFSEYGKAPDNTGIKYDGVNIVSPSFFYLKLQDTGKEKLTTFDIISQAKVQENVGEEGIEYIKWAHNNGYKVWAKISNETLPSTIDEFSYIINDYKLRELMIKDIIRYSEKYNLDGINIDFEYMYMKDKDAFSRFIIELAPQLKEKGICLSVDVTAPNGGENWSLCYDRHLIGQLSNYIVFMAYDQYGTNGMGTTAGYNWVKNNLNNFLGYEEVPAEKIILGLPFYTKLWQTKDDKVIKGTVVGIKDVETVIPSNVEKNWLEDLQQNYIQYDKNGYTYKMWIEDNQSFTKKIQLVKDNKLAGAAYWRKGLEDNSIWSIIKDTLNL